MIARENREKRKRKKVKIPEEKKRETIGKKENEAERAPTVLMLNHGVSIFGPSERRPAVFPFSPLPISLWVVMCWEKRKRGRFRNAKGKTRYVPRIIKGGMDKVRSGGRISAHIN